MKYCLYILKSVKFERYNIRTSSNVEKRLKEHNTGKSKSTRPYRPWILIYIEEFSEKNQAYKREYYLKQPVGYLEKLKIIKDWEAKN